MTGAESLRWLIKSPRDAIALGLSGFLPVNCLSFNGVNRFN